MPIRVIDVDLTAEALGLTSTELEFTADLDPDAPSLTAYSREESDQRHLLRKRLSTGGFPCTVTASNPERFEVRPRVEKHEITWELQLDWLHAGRRGTTVINKDGKPFRLYPERGPIAYLNGIDQLLARWNGWRSPSWAEDLWNRYYAHHGNAHTQASSGIPVEEDEAIYRDVLMDLFESAQRFLSMSKEYLEPSRAMKIEGDLNQAHKTIWCSDPAEWQRMIRVLESDIYGSGLASQLYVAERAADGEDAEDAYQIRHAVDAVREAFRKGEQDTAGEQTQALLRRLFPWHSPH